jgi:ParB-like nuclease domain
VNPIPKLTDVELDMLRESIRQDGVQYPVLVDLSGRVIDGYHRKQIADELGIACPTRTLEVDAETAERLSVTLNLARRHLSAGQQYDLIAWLAKRHETEARAAALNRKAKGGHGGLRNEHEVTMPSSSSRRRPQSRDDIAERINADLAKYGETKRVTGSTVDRALRWEKNVPEDIKTEVRAGRGSVITAIGNATARRETKRADKRTSKRAPAREVHSREQLDSMARVRAIDAETQYQSMLNAPAGRTNLPFIRRAEQIQILLHDLFEMSPEKAVTFVHPDRLPEFSFRDRAEWWLEFTERCEKRWHDEVPELPAHRPTRLIPLAERDLTRGDRTMLDWLRTKPDPVTVIEAAVALRIGESTASGALKALTEADLAEVAGLVDKRRAYVARSS